MLIRPPHWCRHMFCILCVYERLFELLSTSLPWHILLLIIFTWKILLYSRWWNLFAFKIIHFMSRCSGLGLFLQNGKGLFPVISVISVQAITVFLSSLMQIKYDRCVADNCLPLNSCHEWTLLLQRMCLVKHKKLDWLLQLTRWSMVTSSQHWGTLVFHKGQRLNFQSQQN